MANPNIAFLNDLLSNVGSAVRGRIVAAGSDQSAEERLSASCRELMRRGGEATRIAAAEQALEAFAELGDAAKLRFFRTLLTDYSADPEAIRAAYARWEEERSEPALSALFGAVEPRRQSLLRRLNYPSGGTLRLVRMRKDLLRLMADAPDLAPIDDDFSHLLKSWFNRGFLEMRRIDWNSPAAILDKIVAYEAVHAIRDLDDLRRRLEPPDRRCYAFFHPATGDEPLIFVEVALCAAIPDAIGPLLAGDTAHEDGSGDTAVFYSISNCQPGLKGISFGNFLIKQVAADLAAALPHLRTFVTLSPAPGFARWLAAREEPEGAALSEALTRGDWREDDAARDALAPKVQAWAARYIAEARSGSGQPLDPVARFHLGNGASAHRVNWPADFAPTALSRAHGVMINYLYEPGRIEARHEAFANEGTIATGPELRRALKGARAAAPDRTRQKDAT
ncbi:malonyl-CoA decarboxylase family protein [Roseicyclus sp. F158]|uniref:Malonyl-CoA decarboxylase family protein n=1 Tax=Tropicimonas omnivorans TaxID=3075590 RepID=A0ABU3DHB8_9RHOB|nr:malonyl-CoA decarboxylase family protein [Roseicyclus sp. F158]MDT0683111.1 malonyl-CoA decarboxylase family protein [Roseicyclus sp. F158]